MNPTSADLLVSLLSLCVRVKTEEMFKNLWISAWRGQDGANATTWRL